MVLKPFPNKCSTYYNYKGTHSIVLMAMCDASYNFILVDIGTPQRCGDGGEFLSLDMGNGFVQNTLDFPSPKEIDTVNGPIPYYAVADEAFPLLENIMIPFPGREERSLPLDECVFNYRSIYTIIIYQHT